MKKSVRRLARFSRLTGIRKLRDEVGPKVLLYHRVSTYTMDPQLLCVHPGNFEEHLRVLNECCSVLPLRELCHLVAAGRAAANHVAVTFDDGYSDNLYRAKPALERYGVPGTVYVSTGNLDTAQLFWWDELAGLLFQPGPLPAKLTVTIGAHQLDWDLGERELSDADPWWTGWNVVQQDDPSPVCVVYRDLCPVIRTASTALRSSVLSQVREALGRTAILDPPCRPLFLDELKELASSASIEIGSHGVSHIPLSSLSLAAQRNELEVSKGILERWLGKPVETFSYSFGGRSEYDRRTVKLVRQTGYASACTTHSSTFTRRSSILEIPRLVVRDWNGDQFRQWLHV